MGRRRGCEAPLSGAQVVLPAVWCATSALGIVALALYGRGTGAVIALAIYAGLCAGAVAAWAIASSLDVTRPTSTPCPCMRATAATTRHCRRCDSDVAGLDHHCAGLNVCVGARTYPAYFALMLLGTAHGAWHALACALVASGTWGEPPSAAAATVFPAIVAFVGSGWTAVFGPLLVFHIFLVAHALGTVDFLLWQAERRESRALRLEALAVVTAGAARAPNPPPRDAAADVRTPVPTPRPSPSASPSPALTATPHGYDTCESGPGTPTLAGRDEP